MEWWEGWPVVAAVVSALIAFRGPRWFAAFIDWLDRP